MFVREVFAASAVPHLSYLSTSFSCVAVHQILLPSYLAAEMYAWAELALRNRILYVPLNLLSKGHTSLIFMLA